MDHLDEVLMSATLDTDHSPAVRAGFDFGKRSLNKYYELTDMSDVYRFGISKLCFIIRLQEY